MSAQAFAYIFSGLSTALIVVLALLYGKYRAKAQAAENMTVIAEVKAKHVEVLQTQLKDREALLRAEQRARLAAMDPAKLAATLERLFPPAGGSGPGTP